MHRDLSGKVALITGSGKRSGIGYAIARRLAESGTHIVLSDLGGAPRDPAGVPLGTAEEMADLAQGLSRECGVETLALPMDVTQGPSIDAAAREVEAHFGGLDILVNNAGAAIGAPCALKDYDEAAWLKTMDVNLHGTFRVSKRFFPMLAQRKGRIINIASRAGKVPPFLNGAYGVAKAGVIMLTKVMAKEVAASGVRVNAICPAIIMTDLQTFRFEMEAKFYQSTPDERQREMIKSIPLGWIADPAEVAEVAAFLASDASGYVTGQAINVCGGMTLEL